MSNKDLVFMKFKNGVGLVKLNRPERLNAITPALSARLKEILDEACADDSIKILFLPEKGEDLLPVLIWMDLLVPPKKIRCL